MSATVRKKASFKAASTICGNPTSTTLFPGDGISGRIATAATLNRRLRSVGAARSIRSRCFHLMPPAEIRP